MPVSNGLGNEYVFHQVNTATAMLKWESNGKLSGGGRWEVGAENVTKPCTYVKAKLIS